MSKNDKNIILSWVLTIFIMYSLILVLSVPYNFEIICFLVVISLFIHVFYIIVGVIFISVMIWLLFEPLRNISDNLMIKIIMNFLTILFIILGSIIVFMLGDKYFEFLQYIGGLI